MQRLGRIVLQHGHALLDNDRPRIRARIHKMHRDPGHLAAIVQRLGPGVDARERRQQRGMDVQDAHRKRLQEPWLDDAHETRQHNRIAAGLLQKTDSLGLACRVQTGLPGRAVDPLVGNAVLGGAFEDIGVLDIRQHQPDLGVQFALVDRIDDRLHVRSRTGSKHAQFKFRHSFLPICLRLCWTIVYHTSPFVRK